MQVCSCEQVHSCAPNSQSPRTPFSAGPCDVCVLGASGGSATTPMAKGSSSAAAARLLPRLGVERALRRPKDCGKPTDQTSPSLTWCRCDRGRTCVFSRDRGAPYAAGAPALVSGVSRWMSDRRAIGGGGIRRCRRAPLRRPGLGSFSLASEVTGAG